MRGFTVLGEGLSLVQQLPTPTQAMTPMTEPTYTGPRYDGMPKKPMKESAADIVKRIRDEPEVMALLLELRATRYYGIAETDTEGAFPFGGYEKFDEIRMDGEHVAGRDGVRSVRILDALGAVVWSHVRTEPTP